MVIVVLFAVLGVVSGLLFQVLRLVATAVAVLLAIRFSGPAMAAWPSMLETYPAAREFAFPAAIFCGAYLALTLVARLIVALAHRTSPTASVTDRLLGGVVGVGKGVLLSYFLVSLLLSAEQAQGRRIPSLDSERSIAASLVRRYSIGEVRDWNGWPRFREWIGSRVDGHTETPDAADRTDR